jgi:Flp pilus assembly protein TadG
LVHGLGSGTVIQRISRRAKLWSAHRDERGVIAVMFALLLVLMLGIMALVIDLGNARQQRRVAQSSADSAALAGGEAIESGMDRGAGTIPWSTVVTQIKAYAKANDNIPTSAWVGCADPGKLAYRPDSTNNNACISATTSAFPAPSSTSVGNNINYLRVRLPSSTVKSYFAKALGQNDLTVGASSTAKVVFTVTSSQTTALAAGGPCALCILSPTGLTLDGQNGDVTITDGNVIVNSTASTAASLNPNGHVKITTVGGSIGGPGSCAPSSCNNFSGAGFSPAWSLQGTVTDPLATLPQCGSGSPGTTNYCPTTTRSQGSNGSTLQPGIYETLSGSHTLSPGVYVITGGITLNGNDLIQGDGVMLYFACSNYPSPCPAKGTVTSTVRSGITATGNGALRLTGIRQSDCTADANLCPYIGMMSFADRSNDATQTWRGNGTNENGQASGLSGTIYAKAGEMDLRGNGYQMASQIIVDRFTMKGNPSTVTISYDLSKNSPETHVVAGPITYNGTPDNNGLSG